MYQLLLVLKFTQDIIIARVYIGQILLVFRSLSITENVEKVL